MLCPLLLLIELVTGIHVTGADKFVAYHRVHVLPHAGQLIVNVPLFPFAAIPNAGDGNTAVTATEAGPVPQFPTEAIL